MPYGGCLAPANDLELLAALQRLTVASLLRYYLLRLLRTALLQAGVALSHGLRPLS
jgi:hypothetical protein